MNRTLALVLAAGQVDELLTLTERRPKSAVPVFGIYRAIDFVLSNLMHSGITNVGVLSQFRPYSLLRHIGSGEHWDFIGRSRTLNVLPPYRGQKESDWYKGTADAIYQNISYIESFNPDNVLICSADHIYHMDYRPLIKSHMENKAEVTACFTKVISKSRRFGYGVVEKNHKVTEYIEKPEKPPTNLASMTVYLFKTSTLIDLLKTNAKENSHEFGRDLLPVLVKNKTLYGYKFRDPWYYARTVKSYYNAHMALLGRKFDLGSWQVRTNLIERNEKGDRVPTRITGDVSNSVVSEGCVINGQVMNSVLSPGVIVEKGAIVQDSIIFHDSFIQSDAFIKRAICDKDVFIGENVEIGRIGSNVISKEYGELLEDGFTLIGKNIKIPARTRIGANSVIFSTARSIADEIPPGSTLK
jgi:glucose-1-phosphate adenylyltransferase